MSRTQPTRSTSAPYSTQLFAIAGGLFVSFARAPNAHHCSYSKERPPPCVFLAGPQAPSLIRATPSSAFREWHIAPKFFLTAAKRINGYRRRAPKGASGAQFNFGWAENRGSPPGRMVGRLRLAASAPNKVRSTKDGSEVPSTKTHIWRIQQRRAARGSLLRAFKFGGKVLGRLHRRVRARVVLHLGTGRLGRGPAPCSRAARPQVTQRGPVQLQKGNDVVSAVGKITVLNYRRSRI